MKGIDVRRHLLQCHPGQPGQVTGPLGRLMAAILQLLKEPVLGNDTWLEAEWVVDEEVPMFLVKYDLYP